MLNQFSIIRNSILLLVSLALGCNNYAQEKTVLSEKTYITGLPVEVISYSEGKDVTLKELKDTDGNISINYVNKGKELFILVLYLKFDDEILVNYSDTSRNVTLHSSGNVLFSANGYKQTGQNKSGSIKKYINSMMGGVYNLDGMKGTLYAFAVKGSVNPGSILPGNQKDGKTFNACSNVLNIPISF
jgi:hypothetical protein